MKRIDKLLTLVPPPKKPKNVGSVRMWNRVKEQASLPDWLFPLFHAYGSGGFTAFVDHAPNTWIKLLNVFERPLLKQHHLHGNGFTEQNQLSHHPVEFFPQSRHGLFIITV